MVAALALTAGMCVACGQPSMTGGFDAPNPAAKMHATVEAVRTGDRGAVVHIVELLDHDDPAVRLLAITALERLTGRTMGYEYDAPRHERDEAVRRWVQAVQSDELPLHDEPGRQALARGWPDA